MLQPSMTEWETEDEFAAAAAASLPTPTDTPYRTPSRTSRRSSRQKSISPGPSSSPPPLPPGDLRRGSRDVTNDESISILDPRRFTPTLHANLVAEILNLRRDQEEKIKTIENLESDLHNARGEQEQLRDASSVTAKENRSLKRQLALLEGGTSSALSELARERDAAVENNTEIKRRLETAQKKIRVQEDDSTRAHDLWAKDKDNWEEEKRKLERKVHVAEGRLKTVLEEVAAYQATHHHGSHNPETEVEGSSRDPVNGHGSDTASIRTMSMTNSIRFSTLAGANGFGAIKVNGVSLADELDLDDDEDQHTDYDGRESALSVRHDRTQSRESMYSRNHRRNQSTESLMRPGSVARGRLLANQAVLERLEGGILEDDETSTPRAVYVDTGIQPSPPPSPKLHPAETTTEIEPLVASTLVDYGKVDKLGEIEVPPRDWEIEANQRRKRVHATPLILDANKNGFMVSSASQTADVPLSPPKTPVSPTRAPPPPPVEVSFKSREMVSTSTQTDLIETKPPKRIPPPIPIPSIQLHPPKSAPATPREPILPQHSKDFGCQVSMPSIVEVRSISVQTEEIRVDRRINMLPPHLQPSAISSKPPSPEPVLEDNKRFSPVPGNLPARNPRRVRNRQSTEQEIPSSPPVLSSPRDTIDVYPGNNDDGPLMKDSGVIRRPHRISSLFAGFDNVSSDDAEDFADGDMSDNEFKTALSAPKYANQNSKRLPTAPTSVPVVPEPYKHQKPLPLKAFPTRTTLESKAEYGTAEVQYHLQKPSTRPGRQLDKPLTLITNTKPNPMRRAALIQSGVVAHQSRARSPSLPEPVKESNEPKEPPFPIPTRASSRKPPTSFSAPSDGTRSPTWGRGLGRAHYRSNSIRKYKSTTALPRGGSRSYRRQGSRSPPPMSISTEAPESPTLPPMPNNEITSPGFMKETSSSRYRSHRHQPSATNTARTGNTTNTHQTTGSVGSSSQASSVVDAIAQTMVGEWMFKYVRRRKSFGVNENSQMDTDAANGLRHKRWVWLAPYERAVMWSSKQPTSGSALMGKSGRKLVIQSVLDVKDDNPAPKGVGSLFNRSILILTPARALKFTATTSERHYVWLTALSFLAHSSQAVPEVVPAPLPVPQPPVPDFDIPRQPARLRRNGIRDSIRVAKGKTTVARSGPTSVHSSQNGDIHLHDAEAFYDSRRMGDVAADPPVVPRFSDRGGPIGNSVLTHGRKRSNTGSRIPPPLSFRGFSGPAGTSSNGGGSNYSHAPTNSTAGMSVGTNGSSDIYQSQQSGSINGGQNFMASGRSSVRSSDVSTRPGHVVNNFFDAVGTMRMEAFISPMAMARFDDYPNEQDEMNFVGMHRRRSREMRRRSRNRDSYYSGRSSRPSDDWHGGSKTAGEEEYGYVDQFGGHDPFRGF